MTPATHQTVRHAAGVILMRVLEIGGSVLYVALVPRLMGPQIFGQFALLQALTLWFSLMGAGGMASMMTRFVPRFVESDDHASLRKLASGMLALRLLSGVAGVGTYALFAVLLLHVTDYFAVVILALSIGVRTVANLPYTLFLGLNQAARWGVADTARSSLIAPAIYVGYLAAGLRGACGGLLILEVLLLLIGLWWGRTFLSLADFRIDREFLLPYLRFSTAFFFSNVLGTLFRNSGGLVIYLMSGGFVESGYFTLSFGAFIRATQAIRKLLSSFGALFSTFVTRGDTDGLTLWTDRLLKVLAIVSVVAWAIAFSCGDILVRTVIGPSYSPVATLLALLSAAGVAFIPGSITPVLAAALNQPRVAITAAAVQLASFGFFCVVLVPGGASVGACWAVVVSVAVCSAYSVWQIRQTLQYPLRSWFRVVAIGAVSSPLLWAWTAPGSIRALIYVTVFAFLLVALRIVTIDELSLCWGILHPLRRKRSNSPPEANLPVPTSMGQ